MENVEKTYQPKWKYFAQRLKDIKMLKRDSKIFFKSLTNPKKPSENLKKALKEYK